MRAEDLLEPYPSIDIDAPAREAARQIGAEGRVGIVVLREGKPISVLPASQVLRSVVPGYLQEDPALTKVYDEKGADECAARLGERTVRDLLSAEDRRLAAPLVSPETTGLECAALMAQQHTPLLVVVEEDGTMLGVVTAARVLERMGR